MNITTIGLDLAKNVFQVHAVAADGSVVCNRSLRRSQLLSFFERTPPCLVGMEACATSHYWARELKALGHDIREYHKLCVSDPVHAYFRYIQAPKRPSNIMAS